MKIVPCTSVLWLRDEGLFPVPWEATDEQISSVDYITELWSVNGEPVHVKNDQLIVVTFDEISKDFDEWDQDNDELLGEDERYDTVYEYMRECIDHGYHPCRII